MNFEFNQNNTAFAKWHPDRITKTILHKTWIFLLFISLIGFFTACQNDVEATTDIDLPEPANNHLANLVMVSDTTSRLLRHGESIKRPLKGAITHRYYVPLKKGEYIHVAGAQFGIDMVMVLTYPDGETKEFIDSPSGLLGTEHLHLVATEDGDYQIEIRSLSSYSEPGEYAIQLETRRQASEADHKWMAASKTINEATQLRSKTETRNAAIPVYQSAIEQWKEIGDIEKMAEANRALGFTFLSIGDDDQALDIFSRLLPLWKKIGDRRAEAFTYLILASIHKRYDRFETAIELNNKSLAIWESIDDKVQATSTLSNIASLYMMMGNKNTSLRYYNQMIESSKKAGRIGLHARMLMELGNAWQTFGDQEKVIHYYKMSLQYYQKTTSDPAIARASSLVADHLLKAGKKDEAIDYYINALRIWQKLASTDQMKALQEKLNDLGVGDEFLNRL